MTSRKEINYSITNSEFSKITVCVENRQIVFNYFSISFKIQILFQFFAENRHDNCCEISWNRITKRRNERVRAHMTIKRKENDSKHIVRSQREFRQKTSPSDLTYSSISFESSSFIGFTIFKKKKYSSIFYPFSITKVIVRSIV